MSHQRCTAFLQIASLVVIAFGLLMVTALFTPTRALLFLLQDLAFLPLDGQQPTGDPLTGLWTAISGGLMVGWGLSLLLVTRLVYLADPSIGRRIILPSVVAWFLFDSLGSLVVGAWFNVVLNGGFLALFALPLLLNRTSAAAQAA